MNNWTGSYLKILYESLIHHHLVNDEQNVLVLVQYNVCKELLNIYRLFILVSLYIESATRNCGSALHLTKADCKTFISYLY